MCVFIFAEEASHEKGTFNVFCKYHFVGSLVFTLVHVRVLLFCNTDLVTVTQFTTAGQKAGGLESIKLRLTSF